MAKQLIAQVATALIVNGERVVIPAGQPLPDLPKSERAALMAAKAAHEAEAPAADAVQEPAEPAPAPKPGKARKS